jgi:hypothetical protein
MAAEQPAQISCELKVGSEIEGYRVDDVANWGAVSPKASSPSEMCEILRIMSLPKNRKRDTVELGRGGCKVCHRGVNATLQRIIGNESSSTTE